MVGAAAIVLAGGRSTRMGTSKAFLDWHGSTLLRRVTGIAARSVAGPVVVVGAPGQALPALGVDVEVATDAREGRGPLQGLAAGLAAIGDRATVAYLSSTDVPMLHPAFVRCVLDALRDDDDVALPEIGGYHQPLAAAYRLDLLGVLEELIATDQMRPAFLFERCRVRHLTAEAMLLDPALARADPGLESVSNLNERTDYERATALPAPTVRVERCGSNAPCSESRRATVRAWTLGAVADAVDVALDDRVVVALNGNRISRDRELPLASGDSVALMAVDGGG